MGAQTIHVHALLDLSATLRMISAFVHLKAGLQELTTKNKDSKRVGIMKSSVRFPLLDK